MLARCADLLQTCGKKRDATYAAWCGPARKDYLITEICEQAEVLSFSGNIAWLSTERRIHAHVVVGKADGTAQGGHLMEGSVYPTAEIVITELPAKMRRILDEKTGLSLLHTE